MNYFIEDLNVFYATIYGGIIIGFLFDINRSVKNNFKCIRKISFIFDIIFWILATLVTFIIINAVEKFQLRYYHFIALILGFILYYNTISRFILKFNNIIIRFIKLSVKKIIMLIVTTIENLYYIVVYTIHFLFDFIFYIPNIILMVKRKITKKSCVKKKLKKGV